MATRRGGSTLTLKTSVEEPGASWASVQAGVLPIPNIPSQDIQDVPAPPRRFTGVPTKGWSLPIQPRQASVRGTSGKRTTRPHIVDDNTPRSSLNDYQLVWLSHLVIPAVPRDPPMKCRTKSLESCLQATVESPCLTVMQQGQTLVLSDSITANATPLPMTSPDVTRRYKAPLITNFSYRLDLHEFIKYCFCFLFGGLVELSEWLTIFILIFLKASCK